ncbi:MAG: hypothetical protein KIS73_26490 [Enhydrobacter sp.]|nr:hypothetical protein [Enhydrobacter sp.]
MIDSVAQPAKRRQLIPLREGLLVRLSNPDDAHSVKTEEAGDAVVAFDLETVAGNILLLRELPDAPLPGACSVEVSIDCELAAGSGETTASIGVFPQTILNSSGKPEIITKSLALGTGRTQWSGSKTIEISARGGTRYVGALFRRSPANVRISSFDARCTSPGEVREVDEAGKTASRPVSAVAGRPVVVVVLGMHRSGTSLLSGMLEIAGVPMADDATHRGPANPTGYRERREIVELHDQILARVGRPVGSPLHPMPLPTGWCESREVHVVREQLKEFVQTQLAQHQNLWGFKDPRTARLMPLWTSLFDELGVEPRYVWAVRSPAASARSMALKNKAARPMTRHFAELIWAAYNVDIYRALRGTDPIVVDYDHWFDDAPSLARQLRQKLGLPLPDRAADESIATLAQRTHRHHEPGSREDLQFPELQDFWKDIKGLPGAAERADRFVSVWEFAGRTMLEFSRPLEGVHLVREQIAALERTSRSLLSPGASDTGSGTGAPASPSPSRPAKGRE